MIANKTFENSVNFLDNKIVCDNLSNILSQSSQSDRMIFTDHSRKNFDSNLVSLNCSLATYSNLLNSENFTTGEKHLAYSLTAPFYLLLAILGVSGNLSKRNLRHFLFEIAYEESVTALS